MIINIIFFFYLFLLLSSTLMVITNNPLYSVLFLISIFINISIIFIILNVDFLGILILLVYVGAIAILFLFIVMMLNVKKIENEMNTYLIIGFTIFSISFIYIISFIVTLIVSYLPYNLLFNTNIFMFSNYYTTLDEFNNILNIKRIGILLFIEYYICIFFSGIILLISLIGSILLTNFKKGYTTKTQYNQMHRKNNIYLCMVGSTKTNEFKNL